MLRGSSAARFWPSAPTVKVKTAAPPILSADQVRDLAQITGGGPNDASLDAIIAAATRKAEAYTRRAFGPQVLTVSYHVFPHRSTERVPSRPWWLSPGFAQGFEIPRPPLRVVDSVTVYDYAGASSAVPASDYLVNTRTEPGTLVPKQGAHWPSEVLPEGGVEIQIQAGYATVDDVPADIVSAIEIEAEFLLRAALGVKSETIDNASITYASQEEAIANGSGLTPAAKALLDSHRIMYL